MPLSADEIVAAINAVPGITAQAITNVLTIGGLSTEISAIEDQIANAIKAKDTAVATADAGIKTLADQRDALVAQRQALQQAH